LRLGLQSHIHADTDPTDEAAPKSAGNPYLKLVEVSPVQMHIELDGESPHRQTTDFAPMG
jgi:hypothetical protein